MKTEEQLLAALKMFAHDTRYILTWDNDYVLCQEIDRRIKELEDKAREAFLAVHMRDNKADLL